MTDHDAPPPSSLPRLGEPAPAFEADTTQGRLALDDFKGSWVVLFSHPADFTPVCTTEFVELAKVAPSLRDKGVELLGLSIDSIYAHLAWLETIKQSFGVEVPFPVIADHDRAVAKSYGMIMPGDSTTEASRCVFFIDPKGVVRAMIYYPLTTGRNVDEIVRVIDALLTTDADQVATPANWQPGGKVILPAPRTIEDAAERVSRHPEARHWWFCETDQADT
ncbi:MAG: peroxiredoxin [Pseudomonadota bacterium]